MSRILAVASLVSALVMSGCAGAPIEQNDVQTETSFEDSVAAADQVLGAGDAKRAFELYREALALPDSVDPDGKVAAKEEYAKSLFIARNLLANHGGDVRDLVTVIVEHSDAATESAEAKRGIIDYIQRDADSVRSGLPELRETISAEEEYRLPASIYLIDATLDTNRDSFDRLDGPFEETVDAAMELLSKGVGEASMVMERRWVEDALSDLDTCEETLSELDELLDAARSDL